VLDWIASIRQYIARPARQDRRQEVRRSLKLPVEVRDESGTLYRGFTRDLSELGMGAVVSAELKVGDQIWVRYEHPTLGEQNFRAVVRHATVRQRHGYRYGFEFPVPLEVP
jgi:c-di-GMP-binding flagellar brake protein YcgR